MKTFTSFVRQRLTVLILTVAGVFAVANAKAAATTATDPAGSVDEIIQLLLAAELGQKSERPLLASLETAKAAFEAGQPELALNQLNAFQNKARAQLERIAPDLAQLLIDMAQDIIEGNLPRPVFDLSDDFSLTSNPSGAWSYGYSTNIGSPFIPFTFKKYNYDQSGVPVEVWSINSYEVPAVQRNNTTQTVISDGGQGTYPPGTVWFYPGPSTIDGSASYSESIRKQANYGVLRFTVPPDAGGNYSLSTAVRSAYTGPISGDTDFHVLLNGREIFGKFLPREGSASFSDTLSLLAGDTVDFVIGRGADNSYHGSGLIIDATLRQVRTPGQPRPVFDLSDDFSIISNPSGAWSYGYSTNIGSPFIPFTFKKYNYDQSGVPVEVWSINSYEVPAVQRNNTTRTVISDGGQGTYPPGTVWFYPGPSTIDGSASYSESIRKQANYGVLRFTVPPDAGRDYFLSTAVRSAYTGPISGDTDFHVLVNGRQIFGKFLPREGSASFSDTLSLLAGDTVDFVIGRGADNSYHGSGLIIDATLLQLRTPGQ